MTMEREQSSNVKQKEREVIILFFQNGITNLQEEKGLLGTDLPHLTMGLHTGKQIIN